MFGINPTTAAGPSNEGLVTVADLLRFSNLKQPSINSGSCLPIRLSSVVFSVKGSIVNGNQVYTFEDATIKWPNGSVVVNDNQLKPAKSRPSREVFSASWIGFYGGTTAQTGTPEDTLHAVNLETGLEIDPNTVVFSYLFGTDIDFVDLAVRPTTRKPAGV